MKVTIELDFENEPTRYEVYNYLLELMEDKSLCWEINEDPAEWEAVSQWVKPVD